MKLTHLTINNYRRNRRDLQSRLTESDEDSKLKLSETRQLPHNSSYIGASKKIQARSSFFNGNLVIKNSLESIKNKLGSNNVFKVDRVGRGRGLAGSQSHRTP